MVSLLADLLSKAKYKSTGPYIHKSDIPPDLKRLVSASTEKQAIRKKIIIFSVLIAISIISGFRAVYFMDSQKTPINQESSLPVPTEQTGVKGQTAQGIEQKADIETQPLTVRQGTNAERSKAKDNGQGKKLTNDKADKPKPPERSKKPEGEIISEEKIVNIQKAEGAIGFKKPATAETEMKIHNPQRDVYLYTAKTYESVKDYHRALLNYKMALEIDPDNYIIMSNIAGILIRLNAMEESVLYAKNALAIKKDYVPSLINLGIAYIQTGNIAEGEGQLLRALSIDPSNSYALLNLGLLYEKKGDHDKAYSYFLRLLEKGDVQGYLGIARIAEKQGRISEAAKIYREIKALNNINPTIRDLVNDRLLQLKH